MLVVIINTPFSESVESKYCFQERPNCHLCKLNCERIRWELPFKCHSRQLAGSQFLGSQWEPLSALKMERTWKYTLSGESDADGVERAFLEGPVIKNLMTKKCSLSLLPLFFLPPSSPPFLLEDSGKEPFPWFF